MRDYKREKKEFVYDLTIISVATLLLAVVIMFGSCKAKHIVLPTPVVYNSEVVKDTTSKITDNNVKEFAQSAINYDTETTTKTDYDSLGMIKTIVKVRKSKGHKMSNYSKVDNTKLAMIENHSEIKSIPQSEPVERHITAKPVRSKLGFWLSLIVIVPIAFLFLRWFVK